MKPYPVLYKVPQFQKFDGHKENIKAHVMRFFDSKSGYAHEAKLCLGEFFKSLTAH